MVFDEFSNTFKNRPLKNRVVFVLFDEISLSSKIHYDPNKDQFSGAADDETNRQPQVATSVCDGHLDQ